MPPRDCPDHPLLSSCEPVEFDGCNATCGEPAALGEACHDDGACTLNSSEIERDLFA